MTDIKGAAERLRTIKDTGEGYCVAVMDAYTHLPVKQLYADLRTILTALSNAEAQRNGVDRALFETVVAERDAALARVEEARLLIGDWQEDRATWEKIAKSVLSHELRAAAAEGWVSALTDCADSLEAALSPTPTVPDGWLTLDQAPLKEFGSVWSPKIPDRLDIQGSVYAYDDGSREVSAAMAHGMTFTHWAPFRPAPTVKGEV